MKMAYSKSLPQITQMKLKEILRSRRCETVGCDVQVRFQFDGKNACNHNVCGNCLSNMYVPRGNPILYCPKCAQQKRNYVAGVTYECLIKTFTEANICTSCFDSKAIYQETCGHLLCEQCVHSLSQDNLVKCSVRKCQASHKGEVLAEVLLWRKFKLVRFRYCVGKSCKQMAILAIKECKHEYCVGCLKKLSLKGKFLGMPKLEMDTVHCDVFCCFKTVPSSPMKHFLAKLEDVSFMTTAVLEISPILCYSCGNCDGKNVYKARLRNRQCPYQHSFCIDCILSIISKCSVKSACLQTDRIDDHMICQFKGCKIKTPVTCLREIIDVITHSKESTDLFIRKATFDEECSQCNGTKGIVTRIACGHALCKDCLRRTVNGETRWYHECEGDYGKCKYRVPLWVLKSLKDLLKSTPLPEQIGTSDDSAPTTAVFEAPDIVLDKTLDEDGCCLLLKAEINSCVPVGNITWMKNKSVIRETSDMKYRINTYRNYNWTESTLNISSLDKSDEGTYTLFAENCNGKGASNPITFTIPCDPPLVKIKQEQSHGSSIITAEIYSKWPLVKTKWLKNGRTVYFIDEGALEKKESNHFSQKITLNTFETNIGGLYKCVASSLAGENESEEVRVNAFDKPPIVNLSIKVKKSNESVLFVGDIKASSVYKPVVWIKNGNKLDVTDTKKFSVWHFLDESPKLQILHIDETVEGEYQLAVQNSGGTSISNPVPFQIEKDHDRPKIQVSGPYKDSFSITLTAEVESEWPIKSLNWMKNDELIPTSHTYIDITSMSCSKLRIFNVKETGNFQAIAENVAGISKSECIPLLQKDLPNAFLTLTVVPVHDRVELQGKIESVESMEEVMWIKNGTTLVIEDSDKYASFNETKNNPKLMIMKIGREDEGKYSFIAKNQNIEVQSKSTSFIINEGPPEITIQNPVKDGKTIIMDAVIRRTSWPVRSITWERDGTVIKREEKFVNANEISTSRLRLSDLKEAGRYKVIAESAAGRGETEINVLQEEIQISVPPILKIDVDKGQQSVKLEATFETATDMEKSVWMKNDKKLKIKNDDKYQESVISDNKLELVINPISKRDEGEYKVISSTEFGSEESNSAHFGIEEDPPKIINFCKTEEKLAVRLHAVFESEWPVRSIEWYKNGDNLKSSQANCMYHEGKSCSLELRGSDITGVYSLELKSVGGTERSDTIKIEHRETNASTETSGYSPITRTKENILQPITSLYKVSGDCDMCDYTAVAKVLNCGHHFCWKCLEVLADGPQSSDNIVNCLPKCPSWLTQGTIQKLIQDDENSKKQTSLYFKLEREGNKCCAQRCANEAFIKLVFCSHIFCVECIRIYDGNNICIKNGFKCKRNPEQINYEELQKSFADNTVNPFLFECHGKKCDFCSKEIVVFEIYRCGHRLCESCIQNTLLPKRDGEPFQIGKCLQQRCQEPFKFPWSSITKQKKKSTTNTSESKQQKTKSGSNRHDNVSTLPDDDKKENQDNQQNLSTQKRKQNCTNDTSKKQKTVVARFQKCTGLSNVGLSCYRNAILQTLAETPSFQQKLEPYKEKTAWIGLLSIILARIRAQNTGSQDMLDYLHHFHYEFNEKHSEYREFQQEDTLSFLTSILNGVQDEFKALKNLKDPAEGLEDPTSLFRGLLKDKYFCKSCKEVEFFEGESFFSLPLPVTESMTKRGKTTLGSCLRGFLSKEDIDAIPCTYCGSNEITKELVIETYPDVLVLQICKLEEASNSTFERNRSHVTFWETFDGLKVGTKEGKELKEALKHYRLFSVVEHIGSERSGHYICYVRRHGDQKWNRCDDSYVKEVKLEEVRKCDAYLLFYERFSSHV